MTDDALARVCGLEGPDRFDGTTHRTLQCNRIVILADLRAQPRYDWRDDRERLRDHLQHPPHFVYTAVVVGVQRLNRDPWLERIGSATVLDVEVREPSATPTISLQQVERWLGGATTNPNEAMKKAKLKMMLVKG